MLVGEFNNKMNEYKDGYLSKIFAHGKLEQLLGIDYLYANKKLYSEIYDEKSFGTRGRKTIVTEILDNDGTKHSVKMFLWKAVQDYKQEIFTDSKTYFRVEKTPIYKIVGLVTLNNEDKAILQRVHDTYISKIFCL